MSLLEFLFGDKKAVAKKLVVSSEARLKVWKKHLSNYSERAYLAMKFSFSTVDRAVANFDETLGILDELERLIVPELVNVGDEKKTDKAIRSELKALKKGLNSEGLMQKLVYEENRQKTIMGVFQELNAVLKAQLHLISLIKKKPADVRDLLLELFKLITQNEFHLNKPFVEGNYLRENKWIHSEISKLARAVLLEEKIKEKKKTAKEVFAQKVVSGMAPGESKGSWRELGEDLFLELARLSGAPLERDEDVTVGIARLEKLLKSDIKMVQVVKKLRPKFDAKKIKTVILAFREAYAQGHFDDLESEFVT